MAFQVSSATIVKSPLAGTVMLVPFAFTANAVAGSGNAAVLANGFPYIASVKQTNANVMTVTLVNSIVQNLGVYPELQSDKAGLPGDYVNPGNYTNVNNGLAFSFTLTYCTSGVQGAWSNSAVCTGYILVQNVGGLYGSGGK